MLNYGQWYPIENQYLRMVHKDSDSNWVLLHDDTVQRNLGLGWVKRVSVEGKEGFSIMIAEEDKFPRFTTPIKFCLLPDF